MQELKHNKKGFAVVNTLIASAITVIFTLMFAFIFFNYMSDDGITGTSTYADNITDNLIANMSNGATSVGNAIPTVFSIGVFVLIISVLLIAYAVARRNGLIGGGGQLG
jgi:uncharacterized membrane protein